MDWKKMEQGLNEFGRQLLRHSKRALHHLMLLSVPKLLLLCLVAAIFLSVLPLALTLFFCFLVLKLLLLCGLMLRRRKPGLEYHQPDN